MRAICEQAGVRMPTLYHHFGSKAGLLEAVVDEGFARYLALKADAEPTGDPIEDVRAGWDQHVRFGVQNPGFYALMYGQVTPGTRPEPQQRATRMLIHLLRGADHQGRLAVPVEQAAAHVLSANVGVTLHLITASEPVPGLSEAVREATLAAIVAPSSTVPAAQTADPLDAAMLVAQLREVSGEKFADGVAAWGARRAEGGAGAADLAQTWSRATGVDPTAIVRRWSSAAGPARPRDS